MAILTPAPSINVITPSGGSVGPWPTGWTYEDPGDVWVYVLTDDVQGPDLELGADFTLSGANPKVDGGSVTLDAGAIPAGGWDADRHRLVIRRWTARRQGTALPDTEGHKPRATEAALDRAMRIAQENSDDLDLAVKAPPGVTPPTADEVKQAGQLAVAKLDRTAGNAVDLDAFLPNIGVRWNLVPDVASDGATNVRGALALVDEVGPLTLQPGLYLIGSSVTFTRPVTFTEGARMVAGAGVTITFADGVIAPERQIFNLDGGGAVAGLPRVQVSWFAGDLINVVANARPAIQRAYDACVSKGAVEWPVGDLYSDGNAIGVFKGQHTRGRGDSASWLVFTGTVMAGLAHLTVGDGTVADLGMRFADPNTLATDGVAFSADAGAGQTKFIRCRTNGAWVAAAHKNVNGGGCEGCHFNDSQLISHHVKNAPNIVDSDVVAAAFTDVYTVSSTAGFIAGETIGWFGGTNMQLTQVMSATRLRCDTYNLAPAPGTVITGLESGATATVVARIPGHRDGGLIVEDLSEAYQGVNCQWAGGLWAARIRSAVNAQGQRPEHARFTNTYFDHSDSGIDFNQCAHFTLSGGWSAAKAGNGFTYGACYNIQNEAVAKACWLNGHLLTPQQDSTKIRGSATGNNDSNTGCAGAYVMAGAKGYDIDIRSGDRWGFGGYQDWGVYIEDGDGDNFKVHVDGRVNTLGSVYNGATGGNVAITDMRLRPRVQVADIAALSELSTFGTVHVQSRDGDEDDGYAGDFKWQDYDCSDYVATDPEHDEWVAPAAEPTGESGAWRRVITSADRGRIRTLYDFGPDLTPGADNAAAFQAMADWVVNDSAFGATAVVPRRDWCSSGFNVEGRCNIHFETARLLKLGTTGDQMRIRGASGQPIYGVRITGHGGFSQAVPGATSGRMIYMENANSSRIEAAITPYPHPPWQGVEAFRCATTRHDVEIVACLSHGWLVRDCIDTTIASGSYSNANMGRGFAFDTCAGMYVTAVTAYGNAEENWHLDETLTPVYATPGLAFGYFTACIGDTGGSHNWFVRNLKASVLTACWGSSQSHANPDLHGIVLDGCTDVDVVSFIAKTNNGSGGKITGGSARCTLSMGQFDGNGVDPTSTHRAGLLFDSDVDVDLINVQARDNQWGIQGIGTPARLSIRSGCDLRANALGSMTLENPPGVFETDGSTQSMESSTVASATLMDVGYFNNTIEVTGAADCYDYAPKWTGREIQFLTLGNARFIGPANDGAFIAPTSPLTPKADGAYKVQTKADGKHRPLAIVAMP